MARILILSLVFSPDRASTAHIIAGLAKGFCDKGHKVTVLTTTPHYNITNDLLSNEVKKTYLLNLIQKNIFDGISVFRIRMPIKSKNKFKRLLSWGWFTIACAATSLFIKRRVDLIFCCSPPLSIGLSADIISRIRRVPFIYNIQEIYPDIAISSGYLKNKFIISIMFAIEKYIYRRASHITVIGNIMSRKIKEKGVSSEKISVIPNYAESVFIEKNKFSSFITELNLNGKFIFGYAGNFGTAQDIKLIIELAKRFCNDKNVHFLLAGSGIYLNEVRETIKKLKLDNITLLGYIDHKKIAEFYSSVDILFIPLKAKIADTAFPSKAIEIMASGKPIIAITRIGSDLADLVISAKCGFVIDPDDVEKLYETCLACINNSAEIKEMGINGLNYVKKHFTIDSILDSYNNIIKKLTEGLL